MTRYQIALLNADKKCVTVKDIPLRIQQIEKLIQEKKDSLKFLELRKRNLQRQLEMLL